MNPSRIGAELAAALLDGFAWLTTTKAPFSARLRRVDERLNARYAAHRLRTERDSFEHFFGGAHPQADLVVSIVVPIYGIPIPYLLAFVASVEAQTHRRWQLCLCDDGDPSPEARAYLAKLASRDPSRVRLVSHEKNRGIAAATRSALALATGDVAAFADGDDLLHPRALEAIVHAFSDEGVDAVYTDHDLLTEWGHRRVPIQKPGWSPELLLSCNYVNHLVAVRAPFLAKLAEPFPDETNGSQDWHLCFELLRHARAVRHVPLVLYHWRARPGSTAHSAAAKPWAFEASIPLRKKFVEEIDPRLRVTFDSPTNPRLRLAQGALPPIHLLVLGGARSSRLTYGGSVIETRLGFAPSLEGAARRLDEAVANLEDDAWVLTSLGPLRAEGPLDAMVAWGTFPSVGVVWPFRDEWAPLAYTAGGARWVPSRPHLGPFAGLTANVLTGPLHAAMARAGTIRALGGFLRLAKTLGDEARERDALGAALGLAALSVGFRNVAVNEVRVAHAPPPIDALRPQWFDPYA